MPKGYEEMRDKFMKQGLSKKAAQKKAARIWNSMHPENPVGPSEYPTRTMRKAMGY